MGKPTFTVFQLSLGFGQGSDWRIVQRYDDLNKIGSIKQTRGTETSQYPEERTSTETPVVVASEPGPGQCLRDIKLNELESSAIVGDSPVSVN